MHVIQSLLLYREILLKLLIGYAFAAGLRDVLG